MAESLLTADSLPGFEGAEKCLEIWFNPVVSDTERQGLFNVPRPDWEEMLKLVKCTIIHFSSNGDLDAYLLRYVDEFLFFRCSNNFSESSLFVSPFRLVLKTCGTTTLLRCLEKLVLIAKSVSMFHTSSSFSF